MTTDILTATDLKKYFVIGHTSRLKGKPITVKAVDTVSFSIHNGETLGLVGESGFGKSTIAYTITGTYRPTSGNLKFRGEELFQANRKRPLQLRKEIQIFFQDPGSSLNPRRNIKEIPQLPLKIPQPSNNRLDQIIHLLETVDMPPEYMYKYTHMLSGGEKQIVAVARALATNTSLMLLE